MQADQSSAAAQPTRSPNQGTRWCPRRDNCWNLPPARYLMGAKDLAGARYGDHITIDDLAAAAAGLSRAYFSRVFSRQNCRPEAL